MKLFCVKFRRVFDVSALHALYKMFWVHFHNSYIQKWCGLLWSSDAFLEVFALRGLWKKIWSHFLDFCVQKRSCLLWSSDAFRKSSACKVYRKFLGVIPQFMRPKTTWFAMKFRCILEVLALQGLWKNICSHLLDFFVQKRSCLLLGSDEFCKFSPCKLYKKSSGCIFPILGQKNEAVCCWVWMHFVSFRLASFVKKKIYGCIFTIYASKNKVVCCEVQVHFGSSYFARFMKKI